MSVFRDPSRAEHPYKDPTPLPASVPKVPELGVTSAPLKSAAFFIGAHCKEYNGELSACNAASYRCADLMVSGREMHLALRVWVFDMDLSWTVDTEDFVLCKKESEGDPGHCLKEGRRVTRCATDL